MLDLGLKDFAIISNGKTYRNINKSAGLKKLEKQLIKEQRSLSRKYENLKKGESTQKTNIQKQKRSEEHTSELQSPYVITYAVFCLKKNSDEDYVEPTIRALNAR